MEASRHSRLVCSLLAWFLGMFGIHRFIMGRTGLGIGLLLAGWLTFGIWPFIDFIITVAGSAKDGEGKLVTDWKVN